MTTSRRRPGAGAIAAAALSVLVLASGFVVLGVSFSALARPARPAAARWLPTADAVWTVTSSAGQPVAITSGTTALGAQVAESLPEGVRDGVTDTLSAHPGALVWSEMTATASRTGAHSAAASVVIADDRELVEAIGDVGLGGPVRWNPARELLPADPAVGRAWTTAGTVVVAAQPLYTYTQDDVVTALDGSGCVHTHVRIGLVPTATGVTDGLTSVEVTQDVTWCPGRGSVTAVSPATATTGGFAAEQVDAARARTVLDSFPTVPDPAAAAEPAQNPTELLARPLGSIPSAQPAVIVGPRTLVLDTDRTRQGVLAMDAQGRAAWRLTSTDPIFCAPAVGPGVVAVADTAGRVVVLAAASGVARWVQRVGFVPSEMGISGQVLLIADRRGRLYAYRLADGSRLWDDPSPGTGDTVGLAVAADSASVLVATADTVRAVGVGGRRIWSQTLPVSAGPAVLGGLAVIGTPTGSVRALDLGNGAKKWNTDLWRAPVDAVVAAPGSPAPVLAATSAVAGRTDLLSPSGDVTGGLDGDPTAVAPVPDPAAAGGAVVAVTDRDNRIDLLDQSAAVRRRLAVPATSLTRPDERSPGALSSAAVVQGGALWVSGNGGLLQYDLTR